MLITCTGCGIEREDTDFDAIEIFMPKPGYPKPWYGQCRKCKYLGKRARYEERGLKYNGEPKDKLSGSRTPQQNKKKLVLELFFANGCIHCGEFDQTVLCCHHVDDKTWEISTLMWTGHAVATLQKELAKCIPLCKFCHDRVHGGSLVLPSWMTQNLKHLDRMGQE